MLLSFVIFFFWTEINIFRENVVWVQPVTKHGKNLKLSLAETIKKSYKLSTACLQSSTGRMLMTRLRTVSLFLKNPWGHKTSKRASMTVCVTCEQRCREPLPAKAPSRSQTRSHSCFAFSHIFREKERLLPVYWMTRNKEKEKKLINARKIAK